MPGAARGLPLPAPSVAAPELFGGPARPFALWLAALLDNACPVDAPAEPIWTVCCCPLAPLNPVGLAALPAPALAPAAGADPVAAPAADEDDGEDGTAEPLPAMGALLPRLGGTSVRGTARLTST